MDKVLWATAVVAAFLILLSFLHCLGQVHYKLLCHALNSIGVIAFSALSFVSAILFQVFHPYCRGLNRLGTFQLLKRKEAHHLRFGWIISHLAMQWFHCLFLLSLPDCLEIIRLHLFIGAGFQVGHHCFKPFWESTIKSVMLQLGYIAHRETFQE